jgi:WD40 repeat protein
MGGGRPRTLYTKKFGHAEWVTCATYLSDNRIVSGGMDSKLCLWDATGVKCEDLLGHSGSITLVRRLSSDLLLSASYDKTVRVWNVSRKASNRQREVSMIKAGSAPILDASVLSTAAPRSVMTGDRDGCIHIVDLDDEKVSRKIVGAHKGHTTSVLASRFDESSLCFSGGQDGTVRVWDLRQKSSSPAHTLELHTDRKSGKAGAVGFLSEPDTDRNILITGGADGTLKVLDKRKSFKTLFNFSEHMDFIYSLHVRGQLCFSGAGNGVLHVHDWKQGRLLYGLGANKAAVRAIETTPTQLIAAGDDGGVIIYDMN